MPAPVLIRLSPAQIMQGAIVGVMRQVSNIKKNRKPRYGADAEPDWQLHCEGALGEMALARYLGAYWDGSLNDLGAADVGKAQARTRAKDWHDLIIHPQDSDSDAFYLLTGSNGTYQIKGWIRGADGKKDEWWKDPAGGRPAYFVPQDALNEPGDGIA